ncbi:MAG: YkgJ family cysteine cluster protein [Planctomycetes bacterium]|nr:YkgJ family cysteine cluster protein [Planctomycetota bacterium]
MSGGAANSADPQPWYAEGLRFECQACGRCCGGGPGYVWLDDDELAAIAQFLGLAADEFRGLYVRRFLGGMSLAEKADFDCILLDGHGRCTAYDVRPLQCRVWPFWPSNLRSRETWQDAARRCPGIGRGPLIALEQVEALRLEMAGE